MSNLGMSGSTLPETIITILPTEITSHVFEFLPSCSFSAVARVCKQWADLLRNYSRYQHWQKQNNPEWPLPHTITWQSAKFILHSQHGEIFSASTRGVSLLSDTGVICSENSPFAQHTLTLLPLATVNGHTRVLHIYLSQFDAEGVPFLEASLYEAWPILTLKRRAQITQMRNSSTHRASIACIGNHMFVENVDTVDTFVISETAPTLVTYIYSIPILANFLVATDKYLVGVSNNVIWRVPGADLPGIERRTTVNVVGVVRLFGEVIDVLGVTDTHVLVVFGATLVSVSFLPKPKITVVPLSQTAGLIPRQCEIRGNVLYVVRWGPLMVQLGSPIVKFSSLREVEVFSRCERGVYHKLPARTCRIRFNEQEQHLVLTKL